MIESDEFKDDFLQEIVRKAKIEISDKNFEETVLLKMVEIDEHKASVAAKLRISFRYFLFSIVIGMILLISTIFYESLAILSSKTVVIISVFLMLVIAILSTGNYRRLINRYST
ncbi:hypothetical protein [Ekhidna sp.]